MRSLQVWLQVFRGLATMTLTGVLLLSLATMASAQTPQGATLTVVSGIAAVVKANGSASQPAPSGMTLGVGDRIATVGKNSIALVTFFEGSEIELGAETTIIIKEIQVSGNQTNVTVEDVVGHTLSRIKTFANPNSTYRITNPGGTVVAVVRGTLVDFLQTFESTTRVRITDTTNPWCIQAEGKDVACGGAGQNGQVSRDQAGGVTVGGDPDSRSTPNQSGQSTGGETGSDNPGQENQGTDQSTDDEGEDHYNQKTDSPLLGELLRNQLTGGGAAPFTAMGSLLALGMIGWSFTGTRRRR